MVASDELGSSGFDFEFGLASGLRHEERGTGMDRLCRMSLWTVRDSAKATASRARSFERIRAHTDDWRDTGQALM